MNVEIGTLSSTVRTTDSDALLDPRLIEKLVTMLTKRLKQEIEKEKDRSDQQLKPGATAQQDPNWT